MLISNYNYAVIGAGVGRGQPTYFILFYFSIKLKSLSTTIGNTPILSPSTSVLMNQKV